MSLLRKMLRRTIQEPDGAKQQLTGGGRLRTQLGDGLLMYHQATAADHWMQISMLVNRRQAFFQVLWVARTVLDQKPVAHFADLT